MKKDYWLYAVAVVAGVLVWVAVTAVSGRREAWDAPSYFLIGIPIICAVSAALGFVEPYKPWRWGLVPLMAQAVWMIVVQGAGNLLPLGLIVFAVLAIPSMMTAWLGAFIGKKIKA